MRQERHTRHPPVICFYTSAFCFGPLACRLEEAYEAAVQQLGGLQAARPKQLLQLLQPEFPDLALQSIKW